MDGGLEKKRVVACDIETNGLVNCDTVWILYAIDIETREHFHFLWDELKEPSERFLNFFDSVGTWIGHNFVQFDSHVLNKLVLKKVKRKIKVSQIQDTLIMSRLAMAKRIGGHSLEQWGLFFKYPKVQHEEWDKYSRAMYERCKIDVIITAKTYLHLKKELKYFSKYSLRLEHAVTQILSEATRYGVGFDIEACKELIKKCEQEKEELLQGFSKDFPPIKVGRTKERSKKIPIVREVKNGRNFYLKDENNKTVYETVITKEAEDIYQEFNPASSKQVVERMNKVGWKPHLFTGKGQPKVCVENLLTVDKNAPKSVKNLVKYKVLATRLSLFNSWMEAIETKGYTDGRLHGDIISIGAKTHRMAHRNPNTGNIPKENHQEPELDCYAKDIRQLFKVFDKRKCLVGVDISAIQARMLAHYIGDPNYIDIVETGDIHTAHMGYTDGIITERDVSKTFFYAFLFGAGAAKTGSIIGGTSKQGKKLLDTFIERVPGLAKLKNKFIPSVAQAGYLRGIDGRLIRVENEREVLPCMLQGGEAIIMKEALCLTKKRLTKDKIRATIVLVVHDEMQIECFKEDAEKVASIGKQSIIDAGKKFKLKISLDADALIGSNWKETH